MAWADVPAKLTQWRAMEYYQDNPDGVDSLFYLFGGTPDNLATIPATRQGDFEATLDYRINACTNLANSRGWSREMLNQV